jgi:hypothetical protein
MRGNNDSDTLLYGRFVIGDYILPALLYGRFGIGDYILPASPDL